MEHPLVFIEGVGENEVIVCTGCDEPISDAAYKCSQCSFLLHKSCTELQREIQHPVHPNHPLVLIASESRVCDGCRKSSESCFFYHCGECDFDLDIKCASNWQSSTAEDGHQHVFLPILNQIQFTCNICGEDRKGYARVCSICQLLVDGYCAELARTIEIGAHKDHFLTLIFCLDNQVKEQDDQVLCQLCYKTVNTKYGAYYCKNCGFVAHLNCAKMNVHQQFDDSSVSLQYLSMDSVDSATNVTKEKGMEIQHFSHMEHPLVFIEGVGENEVIVCTGCDEPISDAAYKCSQCSFFLHKSCTELQREIQHPVHSDHPLVLIASESRVCAGCRKSSKSCFFYHCGECDNFNLDIKCASIWKSRAEVGHQHEFLAILDLIQFTCKICGEDHKGYGRVCRMCQLFVDGCCAELACTIKIGQHNHFLTLIFCLHNQVKEQDDRVLCQLCCKTVNTKYGAYYCKECGFVVHLNCAKENVLRQFDNLDSSVNVHYLSMDSVDLIIPEEDEAGTWDILEDEHPFVGEHKFIHSTEKKLEDDKFCEVCMELISGSIFYTCATCSGKCNIFIHDTCGNLPRKKQHLLHKHPLTLSFAPNKYNGGTFNCKVCKHFRHGFRYSCDECDYDLDIHCSSIPNIRKHEGHHHDSFCRAIRPFDEKCNGCDSAKNTNGKFVCIEPECNFALGFECAILPVVVKYEYDRHLLKLTYSVEDDSGEYYCFICEEERNPKQWFYYCEKCDFAAHPHCILGKYPYIKYGSTFVDKRHQHPLTFVRKTQFSPPCDICNEHFEGMGIECKQCKFTVHIYDKCLEKI